MADFFRIVEKKYILSKEQYENVKKELYKYMIEDEHGKSTICNIYFDSAQYDLVKHSITKPVFKDKIRLRSYNIPTLQDTVFLEIKRKFDGVVSKRRIGIKLIDFYRYLENKDSLNVLDVQVKKELDYYFNHYSLRPAMFVSYYRRAYYGIDDRDLRITFDSNVIARDYNLSLEKGNYGENIFAPNKYIMEVKTLGSMPMWLVKILNEVQISPCGFSKYGEGYTQLVLNANTYESCVV